MAHKIDTVLALDPSIEAYDLSEPESINHALSTLRETREWLIRGREDERLLIEQELHDGPIQDLYAIRLQLQLIIDRLSLQDDDMQMSSIYDLLQHSLDALRGICMELRPSEHVPFGLEQAIRTYSEAIRAECPSLAMQLYLMMDGQLLPEKMRLALFRIYQEAVRNV